MTLFSGLVFSQELKVSNQRTTVADPNQKVVPVAENNPEGTMVVQQPVERAMNAQQSVTETNTGNPSEQLIVSPMEKTATPAKESQPSNGQQTPVLNSPKRNPSNTNVIKTH